MSPTELSRTGAPGAADPDTWVPAVRSACAEVSDATEADRVDGVEPRLVARPGSTEQVSEVLRAAAAHGLRVVPRGRGTKMTWGLPPASVDLVVDVSALDQVLDHASGDLIVDVQAGARLADVQEVLARGGQRLAVDETVAGGSIGGTLATNASGPLRHVTGTMRDLLIGITVVRADGVVAKAGGRVVKNVAGYDLGKLMIGSYGTLGVVTGAVFRLHPLPEVEQWVTLPVDGPDAAHDAVHAVVHSQAVPVAVELDLPEQGAGSVAVLLAGRPDGVAGRVETVCSLLGPASEGRPERPEGWGIHPAGPGEACLKLTFVLSGLRDVLGTARQVGAAVHGAAGIGVLHATLTEAADPADAVRRLRVVCSRHGGSLVVLDAPGSLKESVDVWGPVAAVDLMHRVKDRFDPDHRLAPGRFVGGI